MPKFINNEILETVDENQIIQYLENNTAQDFADWFVLPFSGLDANQISRLHILAKVVFSIAKKVMRLLL